MGTHAKTAHKTGKLAPSPFVQAPAAMLASLGGYLTSHPLPADDAALTAWYDTFAADVHAASALIHAGQDDSVSPAYTQDQIWQAVHTTLSGLSKAQLLALASQEGFEHPELAASGAADLVPLTCWLDPAYPGDAPYKLKVQALAYENYASLCQGQAVHGLTLASLQPDTPFEPQPATIAGIGQAEKNFAAAITSYKNTQPGSPERAEALAALIAAENKLITAECPDMAAQLDQVKNDTAQRTSKVLGSLSPADVAVAVSAGQHAGVITAGQASVLSPGQAATLLRASSWPGLAHSLAGTAAQRQAQLAKLQAACTTFAAFLPASAATLALPDPGTPGGSQQVAGFAGAAGEYLSSKSAVQVWAPGIPGLISPAAPGWLQPAPVTTADELTGKFLAWGKKQDLGPLRDTAATLGLTGAEHSTKMQALKYIAAEWDPSASKDAIQQQVAGHAPGSDPVKITLKPPSTAQPQPQPEPAITISQPPPAGFAAKHKQLVAALAQAKATGTDLPPRMQPGTVAAFAFGKGKTAVLGGMHAKTIHTGPDGKPWLFKPDKHARGARAHAEAAASALLHAGGVPSVPVYAVTIDGKPGAVQPLVHGATQLGGEPASWTQAEADAIVRYHVAAWMTGDHDSHAGNILRTPSGGMIPIDQGQAFKFYGTDKLDMSYHPNATYGAERPVYHQLYEAHLAGKLAPGVTVNPLASHAVIKQYEKMPDTQLRAILHEVAHKGAASGVVAWIPAMRARAAQQHGIPEAQVSKAQIGEAFLDHACERKHGLRAAFAQFFTGDVNLPAATALRHGS